MKKILSSVAILATFFVVSCGPSAEEKAAAEKRIQDSIATVEKNRQDSIMAAEAAMMQMRADSLAKVVADSTAAAEVAAAAAKKGGKKAPPKKNDDPKKGAGQVGELKKGNNEGEKINVLKKGGK
jgi:uncharacterized membrane protein YgcG